MNKWGCFGLILGGLVGLLAALLVAVAARDVAAPAPPPAVAAVPADITLFLSERSLSRLAANALNHPALVESAPEGRLEVTTPFEARGLKFTVRLGLTLTVRDGQAISRLDWVKLGFITLPAAWLPAAVTQLGTTPGEIITQQIPQGFSLVGLTTTAAGINFQFKWKEHQ
jgi:hypothetical protein